MMDQTEFNAWLVQERERPIQPNFFLVGSASYPVLQILYAHYPEWEEELRLRLIQEPTLKQIKFRQSLVNCNVITEAEIRDKYGLPPSKDFKDDIDCRWF
jgi:hypothetical protein